MIRFEYPTSEMIEILKSVKRKEDVIKLLSKKNSKMDFNWNVYYTKKQSSIGVKCQECPAKIIYTKEDENYKISSMRLSHQHSVKKV